MESGMGIRGLHHTSSVSAEIERNAAFYTEVLGMRFVYKSINQDDVSMYHLAYGDGEAASGSVVTFFDIPNAARNHDGRQEVSNISLRVRGEGTLEWWASRFDELGVTHGEIDVRYDGRRSLDFVDDEGHRMSVVDDGGEGMEVGEAWTGSGIPAEKAIRGIEAARMAVKSVEPTAVVLTDVMGFRRVAEYRESGERTVVFESGEGGPGTEVHVQERPELPVARPGAGGVHHIAFRVADDEEIAKWAARISGVRLPNSGIVDRDYFRALYFREPNGILFEISTDQPGWAKDGIETLGHDLVLPEFMESRREEIEANLKPILVGEHKGK